MKCLQWWHICFCQQRAVWQFWWFWLNIRSIILTFMVNSPDFGDPLTSPVATPTGWCISFSKIGALKSNSSETGNSGAHFSPRHRQISQIWWAADTRPAQLSTITLSEAVNIILLLKWALNSFVFQQQSLSECVWSVTWIPPLKLYRNNQSIFLLMILSACGDLRGFRTETVS